MAVTGAGLEGIVAAESKICYIDGDAGILSYQGYPFIRWPITRRLRKSSTCCGTAACPSRPSSTR